MEELLPTPKTKQKTTISFCDFAHDSTYTEKLSSLKKCFFPFAECLHHCLLETSLIYSLHKEHHKTD